MPPIAKEKEVLTATPDTTSHPADNDVAADANSKPQPVAVEVSVTVNGVRTVEGSDKREPFSESTKTVLVFGNGAVIRLTSPVTPGQLVFLTNEKTKKEVVCQVVKSKNYRSASGYVELEFTESVVGFWGLRFPSDRLVPAPSVPSPQAEVENATPTIAPSIHPPQPAVPAPAAVGAQPNISATKSVVPSESASATSSGAHIEDRVATKPASPVAREFGTPRAPDEQASILAPPQAPAPVSGNPETEALKHQTARLQEQLSNLLFMDAVPAQPAAAKTPPAQAGPAPPTSAASKVLEIGKTATAPAPAKTIEMRKPASPPAKSSLDEELQIPAWLEPLARNAAPTSTQDLIEREKAKRLAEREKVEKAHKAEEIELVEEISAVSDSSLAELQDPESQSLALDDSLGFEENVSAEETGSENSGKGLKLAAIAAGVLLLAGGAWWYMRPQSRGVAASAVAPQKSKAQALVPAVPAPANTLQPQATGVPVGGPQAQTNPADRADSGPQTRQPQNNAGAAAASSSVLSARNDKAAAANPANSGGPLVNVASSQPVSTRPKKPALGQFRLATPTVKRQGGTQGNAEAEAALTLTPEQPTSNADALGAGLAVNSKGPAAPVTVGGDVKTAKLLSAVPPVYPALAKNQHISGNVLVDALIDTDGHVTTMKVVSGPTLLHQAAMDALRQWRYQPATLDGKPVPMHLTVTIQFRLQ